MSKGLTDRDIKNAKPKGKKYKIYDSYGLFMIIAPSGGKWWRFKYRLEGKEKQLSLGTYLKVSLSEARVLRDDFREMLRQGFDPSIIRKAEKAKLRQEKMEQDARKAAERKESKNGSLVSVRCVMDSPIEIWKGGNVIHLSEDEARYVGKQLTTLAEDRHAID